MGIFIILKYPVCLGIVKNHAFFNFKMFFLTWQIKTTIRYHLSSVRMATTNKEAISAGEDEEKEESSGTARGNANWCSHNLEFPQKIKNKTTLWQEIPLQGIYPKKPQASTCKHMMLDIIPLCSWQDYAQQPMCGAPSRPIDRPVVKKEAVQIYNKIFPFGTIRMGLEGIMLSEIN